MPGFVRNFLPKSKEFVESSLQSCDCRSALSKPFLHNNLSCCNTFEILNPSCERVQIDNLTLSLIFLSC